MDTAVSINLSRGQSEIFEKLQNLPMKDGIRIFVDRSGKIEDGWCVGAGVVFLPGKFGPSVDLHNRLLKGVGTDYLPADLKLENVEETPRLKRVLHELVPQLGSMG